MLRQSLTPTRIPISSRIEIGPSVSSRGFISSFSPEDFDNARKRTIELKLGQREVSFNGRDIRASTCRTCVFT